MNMINELKNICERGGSSLLQDAAGAFALGIMLIVALHLPAFS